MDRDQMLALLWKSAEAECHPDNLGSDGTLSVHGTQAVFMALVAAAIVSIDMSLDSIDVAYQRETA